MKVQLFNPSVHHYMGVHYRLNPPLGLPIIAAVLERAGHSAEVWDLEALRISPRELAQAFGSQKDNWPDAVGFTVTTQNRRGARESVEALRGIGYDRPILVGGPGVALNYVSCAKWGTIAVVGECEGNVINCFESAAAIQASQTKSIDFTVLLGESMPIEDIPSPLWTKHHPRPREYGGNAPKIGHPEGISMWSRGCPHQCVFCSNPLFKTQRIRYRPPRNVYEDMAELKRLGVRSVFVYDDELVGTNRRQSEWLKEVCALIAPLGLTWKCQGRCNRRMTSDVLQAMYDAGCRAIMWGVESFSDKVLKAIKKGTTEEDIWHTLRLAREADIGNWIFLMVANYQETVADLRHTEQQMKKAREEGLAQWRQVTVCTPEPGTELWDLAKAEGWLVELQETGPQMAQAYFSTPWLSRREIAHWRNRLYMA